MIIVLFKKLIYMLRIHVKQNTFVLLKEVKNDLDNLKDSKAFTEYLNNM